TAAGGNDLVEGGAGDDDLDGGTGEDFLSFLNSAVGVNADLNDGTSTGNGTDSITGFGNVFGSSFADTIDGDGGDNLIIGREGNDVIAGFVGSDFLDGGSGEDLLDHQLRSGPGPVTVDLGAGTVTGMGSDTIVDFESVNDTESADTIRDDGASRTFILLAGGDDTVTAAGGNDLVEGGAGDDDLDGGTGEDFLSFLNSPAGINADLGAGTSTGNGTDSVTGFGNVFGSSYADTIDGDAGDNLLLGLDGDDVISGFVGRDFLDGGAGIDSLDGGAGSDSCLDGETLANCE
ncbi:MAG: hypothetical protein M3Q18_02540, partial [Actinomycetota bacterium]|nr:hypothetical protein [Actinomycetota bacterium]